MKIAISTLPNVAAQIVSLRPIHLPRGSSRIRRPKSSVIATVTLKAVAARTPHLSRTMTTSRTSCCPPSRLRTLCLRILQPPAPLRRARLVRARAPMEGLMTRLSCVRAVPPLRLTTVSHHLRARTGLPSSPMTYPSSSARGALGHRFLAQPFLPPTARFARYATLSTRLGAAARLAIPLFARAACSATPKVVADPRTPSSRSLNFMGTVGGDGFAASSV